MFIVRFLLISVLFFSSTLWASVGKVSLLKGEAFIERGSEKITLQNGTLLEEKDTIKTAKDAQMQIVFEDKTVITLGGESEFKIDEYLNDAQNPKAKFKFNQGTFKTITGQIGKKAPENFTMETKTATIGIRGTIVLGRLNRDGDTIGCLRGAIVVKSEGKEINVPAGQMTRVIQGNAPSSPQKLNEGAFSNNAIAETNTPPASQATNSNPTQIQPPAVVEDTQSKNNEITNFNPETIKTLGNLPSNSVYLYGSAIGANFVNKNLLYFNIEEESDGMYTTLMLGKITNSSGATTLTDYGYYYDKNYGGTVQEKENLALNSQLYNSGTLLSFLSLSGTSSVVNDGSWVGQANYTGSWTSVDIPRTSTLNPSSTTGYYNIVGLSTYNSEGVSIINGDLILNISRLISDPPVAAPAFGLVGPYGGDPYWSINDNQLAYVHDNFFGIVGFAGPESWLVAIPSDITSQTAGIGAADDYVSWGYWSSNELQSTVAPIINMWVGGVLTTLDLTTLNGTSYTYNGKVIGTVSTESSSHLINTASSDVKLIFDFGSAYPLNSSSYIRFTANNVQWDLAAANGSSFIDNQAKSFYTPVSTGSSPSAVSLFSGEIKGKFFGSSAQAVGGTFQATSTDDQKAIGAFKAVR